MSRELLIAASPGELWAADCIDGKLAALRVLRPGRRGRVGELILGRVVALRPELPAVLVDIGLDRPAFLSAEDTVPRGDIARLHEGQAILVQVRKEARADKAPGLSMRVRLRGRLLELMPTRPGITAAKGFDAAARERLSGLLAAVSGPEQGFALRPGAATASPTEIEHEADALRARWRALEDAVRAARAPEVLEDPAASLETLLDEFADTFPDAVVIDDRAVFAEARSWFLSYDPALARRLILHRESSPLFEHYGIAEEIALALAPNVPVMGGGGLTIEHTAAAILIDVDSGGGGRRREAADAILALNTAAAAEVARQIRLRNLAGPIVIDFIGMRRTGDRDRVRAALAAALAAALIADADIELLGWTRLGHFELTRRRLHASPVELLFERAPGAGLVKRPVTVALEALWTLARAAAASPARAPALHVHPEVAAALDGEAGPARHQLEERLGRAVAVIADPTRPRASFDIRLG